MSTRIARFPALLLALIFLTALALTGLTSRPPYRAGSGRGPGCAGYR